MDVNDPRTIVDFQKTTFSGHQRNQVIKVFEENIKQGNADYACYWGLELLCSGLIHSLWRVIFDSVPKHINRAAPNAVLFAVKMYERFAPYESMYPVLNITEIRNNPDVRLIITETIAGLTLCRKNKLPTLPKIKPEEDFDKSAIQEKLLSPNPNLVRRIMRPKDALDLYIPFNEFFFCLQTKNLTRALYWMAWVLKFASKYKKTTKTDIPCEPRMNKYISDKFCSMPIWILWEIVFDFTSNTPTHQYAEPLYKMYCLNWSPSVMKSRLCFLINSIQFICETVLDTSSLVPSDAAYIHKIIENIPEWISAIVYTRNTFS